MAKATATKVGHSEYGSFHVDRTDGHRVLECYGQRHTLLLPVRRSDRIGVDGPPLPEYVTPPGAAERTKQSSAFRYLQRLPIYPGVLALLQAYVARVIPDPLRSQGLWSLAAHEAPVCVRLNVGNTEVLTFTDEGGVRIFSSGEGIFERKMHSFLHEDDKNHRDRLWVGQSPYVIGQHVPLRLIGCAHLKVAEELLEKEFVLDGAYWLVRELMLRQGPRWAAQHNREFAADVLEAAWKSASAE